MNNESIVMDLNLALLENFLDNADRFASDVGIFKPALNVIFDLLESSQGDEQIKTNEFAQSLFDCLKRMKLCLADLIAASPLPKKDFSSA